MVTSSSLQKHFDEQRRFITERLNLQLSQWRDELRAGLAQVRDELRAEFRAALGQVRCEQRAESASLRADIARLERRLDAHDLEFRRLADKMDAHHEATHLVLREVLRRLPPEAGR